MADNAAAIGVKKTEPLFSKKRLEHMREMFWAANPISNQVLGICSALAVTAQVETALWMVLALTFVLCMSNLIISLIRNFIPGNIRIIVYMVVIASLVVIIDEVLRAFVFDVSRKLSVFVGLIITNCIVMGRAEAFAVSHGWWDSLQDGFANSMGYGAFLLAVALPREFFGSGSILGIQLIPDALYEAGYVNSGLMVLAPAAFILLGLFIWLQKEMIFRKEGAK